MKSNVGKLFVRAAAALGVGALIALGGVTAANATTEYPPEGGTWYYFADSQWVYSSYQHNSRTHKTTACNWSECDYSGWKAAGVNATAIKPVTLWGNTAYYAVQ